MPPLSFRLFGFPVSVLPQFLLLMGIYALFGVQRGEPPWQIFAWWMVMFGSILLHEFGHAAMCRLFHVPVYEIRLHGLGGDVLREPSGPGSSLLISLAGPFAGLALGALVLAASVLGLGGEGTVVRVLTGQLLWTNVGWSLLNLLPMRPLDGGNALLSGLLLVLPRYASAIAHGLGAGCGAALVAFGLWAGEPFVMLMGGMAGWANVQALRAGGR